MNSTDLPSDITNQIPPPAKLSDLMEPVEFAFEESRWFFDRQTNTMVLVKEDLLGALEDGEEIEPELWEFDESDIEIAKAVLDDSAGRFVVGPDHREFHGYRQMVRFIDALTDDRAVSRLSGAIAGKGAFRRFRDTAADLGLLQEWYAFLNAAQREFVIDWARYNQVEFVDDTNLPGDSGDS